MRRFDKAANGPFIYPGRSKDWDGSDLFEKWTKPVTIWKNEINDSSPLNEAQFNTLTK